MLQAEAGCAEVDSMTEAVAGESFMLGCISCKRREEVEASTSVDWFFRPIGEEDFVQVSLDDCTSFDLPYGLPAWTLVLCMLRYQ